MNNTTHIPAVLRSFALKHSLNLRMVTLGDGSRAYNLVKDGKEISRTTFTTSGTLAMMRQWVKEEAR